MVLNGNYIIAFTKYKCVLTMLQLKGIVFFFESSAFVLYQKPIVVIISDSTAIYNAILYVALGFELSQID
jgi:hypothetical protein